MGERLLCKQEAVGSIPSSSTKQRAGGRGQEAEKSEASLGAYLWLFGQKISVVL